MIDEELDRSVIAALEGGDADALRALDRERLNAAPGTPEATTGRRDHYGKGKRSSQSRSSPSNWPVVISAMG